LALLQNQLMHIETMLAEYAANPPTWLVVVGHYPIYSNGAHGDISELVAYLQPLLERYGVHAYIAGHDHFSAHLQHHKIEYFIAGAGSMLDSAKYTSQAEKLIWYDDNHPAFAYVDATASSLSLGFVDSQQNTLYTYTLTNPGPTHNGNGNGNNDDPRKALPLVMMGSLLTLMSVAVLIWWFVQKNQVMEEKRKSWKMEYAYATLHYQEKEGIEEVISSNQKDAMHYKDTTATTANTVMTSDSVGEDDVEMSNNPSSSLISPPSLMLQLPSRQPALREGIDWSTVWIPSAASSSPQSIVIFTDNKT